MLVPPLNLRGDDRVDARLRLLWRGVYKQWWYYYDGATPTAGLRRNYKFMTTSLAAGDDGGGAAAIVLFAPERWRAPALLLFANYTLSSVEPLSALSEVSASFLHSTVTCISSF